VRQGDLPALVLVGRGDAQADTWGEMRDAEPSEIMAQRRQQLVGDRLVAGNADGVRVDGEDLRAGQGGAEIEITLREG
jgi:hypothetical protein